MRVSICILAFFGMIWCFAALLFAGATGVLLAAPPVVAAVVLAICLNGLPSNAVAPGQTARIRRIVRRWSLVEGAAMIAAVLLLQRMGAQRHIPSVFAVIVGLHFLPLAIGFPQPIFYVTGAFMIVAGILSAGIASAQVQGEVAASAAAVALWGSALGLMLFYRRAPARPV